MDRSPCRGIPRSADPDARAGRSWALVAAGIVSSAPVLLATIGAPDWAAAFAAIALVAAAVALGLMPGTAPAVRGVWFGVAAFAAASEATVTRRSGWADGDIAWIASEGRTTGQFNGRAVDRLTTETMVLKRHADGWRIHHIHWSSRAPG